MVTNACRTAQSKSKFRLVLLTSSCTRFDNPPSVHMIHKHRKEARVKLNRTSVPSELKRKIETPVSDRKLLIKIRSALEEALDAQIVLSVVE